MDATCESSFLADEEERVLLVAPVDPELAHQLEGLLVLLVVVRLMLRTLLPARNRALYGRV